jgi:2-dehydro-3-deoxygluconokinase
LLQADQLRVSYTGGEANVAVALAQWGLETRMVSRVPRHALGDACLNHLRRYGVDTRPVLRGGDRLGLLFVEAGVSVRAPQVVYDRQHTAFRELRAGDLDWDSVFADASWLHVTGTAPALGAGSKELVATAFAAAKARGLRVSFDCSYRSALWSISDASSVLPGLLEHVDVFIGSESDAGQFFDIHSTGEECLREFQSRYGLQCVAFSRRTICPTGQHAYSAHVGAGSELHVSRVHEVEVVDRIGAGDAFAAGIIRGLLLGRPLAETTEFAAAAAALAHTIPGDFALVTVAEIERLSSGGDITRGWR